MSETKEKFNSVAELAERWGKSHSAVLSLIYSGQLRAIDVSANPRNRSTFRIPQSAVEDFEQRRTVKSIPDAPAPRRQRVKIRPGSVIEFIK